MTDNLLWVKVTPRLSRRQQILVIPNSKTWNYLLALMLRSKLTSVLTSLEIVQPSWLWYIHSDDHIGFFRLSPQKYRGYDQRFKGTAGHLTIRDINVLLNMMNVKSLASSTSWQTLSSNATRRSLSEKALILKDIHGYSEDVFGFVSDNILVDSSGN